MILLTGASGFLGKHIHSALLNEEHQVTTLGRSEGNDIACDLATSIPQFAQTIDYVVHCSGKAHVVPINESEVQAFFDVNAKGTKHLLNGMSNSGTLPKGVLLISTIAVYGKESGSLLTEQEALNATDPYGLSKIQAERIVMKWCRENNVICTILRLPLIIGLPAVGNLKAMISGIAKGYYFNIAGGKAQKSMVLADDVAKVIFQAAQTGGTYHITDRQHPTFLALSLMISHQLSKKPPLSIPFWLAKIIAAAGQCLGKRAPINLSKLNKITSTLTFDDSKAVKLLNWNPTPVLEGLKFLLPRLKSVKE